MAMQSFQPTLNKKHSFCPVPLTHTIIKNIYSYELPECYICEGFLPYFGHNDDKVL